MKSKTLNVRNPIKFCAITLIVSVAALFTSSSVQASLVTGNAQITIDNAAFAAANFYANYVEKHWGPEDNTLAIDGATLGGYSLPVAGVHSMDFAVNSNTTGIDYPAAGAYGRSVQATTMDTADTSVGQIGLSGAWRINGQGGVLTPYDFRLMKTAGIWKISSYDNAFGYVDFLQLSNVNESLNASGELLLSGDLSITGLWANLLAADNRVVGSIGLAPSAVPVPAAVWFFVSGLVGLVARGQAGKSDIG